MFPWECCLQVKLFSYMPIPAFHSLLSRPPATATGAAEAAKEKAQGELNTKVSGLQFAPQLCCALEGDRFHFLQHLQQRNSRRE